jgi:hypothetical protein
MGCAMLLGSGAAQACRQALALGLDVSASVSTPEYWLQRNGLAAALRDPQVQDWMIGAAGAEVDLLVFEWGDRRHQAVWLEWTKITSVAVLEKVAARIAAQRRSAEGQSTAIGAAMQFGLARLNERRGCDVRTLDISGDGKNNVGPLPREMQAVLGAAGVTVNGLVVATQEVAELTAYYHANVIVGPMSFVETAGGFEDYAKAIKRKLLRELVPGLAWVR